MKYDVYQSLKEKVQTEDFYTKYKGLQTLMFWLSFVGNVFCIGFGYFHVNESILQTLTSPSNNAVLGVMALSIFVLCALEAIKRLVFAKLTKNLTERKMKWGGAELNMLAGVSTLLIAASFYLSLTGAQQYADKEDAVTTQVDSAVTSYQDTTKALYERKIKVLEDRNVALFDANNALNSKALGTRNRADLMSAISANTAQIAKNEESIKELKKERDADIEKYATEQKSKGGAVVEKSKQNVVRFVSFSTIAEIIILCGVFFAGYFPYKAKVEYDKLFDSDPKYKLFEQYRELLQVIYKAGEQAGGYTISKVEMVKLLRLVRVNLSNKDIDDMIKVLKHLDILRKRGNKNVFNLEQEKALVLIKEYLKIS